VRARAGPGRPPPEWRAGHRQPDALVLLRHLARLPDPAGLGAVRPPPRGGVDRRRPGHHGRLLRHLHARPHVLGHAASAGPVRARGHRRAGRAGLRGVRQGLDDAVDLRVRRHRLGARGRARRAAGGHARGRRGRGLLRLPLLGLPFPRPALPHPALRPHGRAVPRGHRRRPRLPGQDPDHPRGTGLRGMSERLSAVGGRLSLGSAEPSPGDRNDRGFRLVATVPAAPAMAAAGHNCPP